MIMIAAALLGAFLGIRNVRKRKGSGWDMAQYAAVYAIAFSLVGLVITLIVHRSLI